MDALISPVSPEASLSQSVKSSAVPSFLLNPLFHLAVLAAAALLLSNFALAADGFDLSKLTKAICTEVKKLTGAELLGVAAFVVAVIFGWNKVFGDSSAFQGVKNAVIGAVIIGAAGTVATAFGGGCA